MVQSTQVLSLKQVNAVDAYPAKLSSKVVLCALKPIGDVVCIGHRCRTAHDVHSRSEQDGKVVA